MWIKHPFFKYLTAFILVLLALHLLSEVDFIVDPIRSFITTLFFPLLISGFLYYLLKPVVHFLSKSKYIPRTVAILLVFLVIIGGASFVGMTLGGTVEKQVNSLMEDLPSQLEDAEGETARIISENNFGFLSYGEVKNNVITYLSNVGQNFGNNIMNIISTITSIATVLLIVPFILFYLLKDDRRFSPFLLKLLPDQHKGEGERILSDIDRTLSMYIVGQMIVALVNGVLMYIGYLIIGLDYALLLAFFVVLTAVVPILGPALGVLPAILVGLMMEPFIVVKILILLIIVQETEGSLVSPLVIGNKLEIHPLTVMLLLLVAGSLYGFIGILIAIPAYSVLKVTIKNFYGFYMLRNA
ncbi:AI-2E family transporter [Metabacillus herbersteinensis]|uniref:AI-2E family transporter n=1 Tax=Metabacillus herbersteinensis TaxID=283816 RepID=A0ABV6GM01_9BACI